MNFRSASLRPNSRSRSRNSRNSRSRKSASCSRSRVPVSSDLSALADPFEPSSFCQFPDSPVIPDPLDLSNTLLTVDLAWDGIPVRALLDSGSQQNFISSSFVSNNNLPVSELPASECLNLVLADGSRTSTCSSICSGILSDSENYEEKCEFYVAPLKYDLIL